HGASISARTLSDMITEMEIVNAMGELVTYSETKDPEAFSAACLNLGLLGIHFGKEQFNDNIWLKQWERTTEPANNLADLADRPPMVDNPFFASFHVGERIMEVPDAIHFPIGDGVTTVVDAGAAFKVDDDFKNAVDAFNDLVER
ncbi:hypothetical protein BGZ92_007071, partial [Podila epicladia]